MNKVHYNVSGIQNKQIKTQLKNVLNDLDGVQMVNVDQTRSSIEVGYNNSVKESDIAQGIQHVGCKIQSVY